MPSALVASAVHWPRVRAWGTRSAPQKVAQERAVWEVARSLARAADGWRREGRHVDVSVNGRELAAQAPQAGSFARMRAAGAGATTDLQLPCTGDGGG